jgi:hypothetical protein
VVILGCVAIPMPRVAVRCGIEWPEACVSIVYPSLRLCFSSTLLNPRATRKLTTSDCGGWAPNPGGGSQEILRGPLAVGGPGRRER